MVNPFMNWLTEQGIAPFSPNNPLIEKTGLTRDFLGKVATDQRRCSNKTLELIKSGTGEEVEPVEMLQYWLWLDRRQQAELREPSEPLPCSEPTDTTGEQITLDLEQGAA